ncbi:hypothetical protein KZ829_00395 [Actinoplanes hulinensis]|uniref:DUF2637 domain-containing protein n=1 Tax=Actinoplanes hulinensis TaxID=1144547 RepID=A0ABS7ATS0_9ACTN|nr:DUF2637 domain-containing protein [Actinoplanes hulinensis]MBW6432205.1 hypothetical protein [Actinoplanes hulinensis]
MNVKYQVVKLIVKLYFFGALAVSFTHVIEASHKLDLHGWQAWTTPFAIDGIAVIGMVMRGAAFSRDTRRLGFRVQVAAGLLSLACNVFAGSTVGERVYGVLIVALFVFSEWLSDRMQGREVDVERERVAKRAAAAEKAKATRAANKEAAERLAKSGRRRLNRELAKLTA